MMKKTPVQPMRPLIPYLGPRDSTLSEIKEEHHYHVISYSWSEGHPVLTLLPLEREKDLMCLSSSPFDIDLRDLRSISFWTSGSRNCIGRFEEGAHIACPETRKVDRFPQCSQCMAFDIPDPECIFEPHCHTGPCGADFCQVEHVVYLTAFRERLKVGMTQLRRMRTRAMEQGADAFLPLVIVKDRFSARSCEGAISRIMGVPQMVPSHIKIRNMSSGKDPDVIRENLMFAKEDLIMLWEEARRRSHPSTTVVQDPGECSQPPVVIDDYPLLEPLPSRPKRIKGSRITGDVIGFKGSYMMMRQGGIWAFRMAETPGMVLHSSIPLI